MVRTVLLTVMEVLSVLAIVYGIALVYLPAAFIVAGLVGVVAVEKTLAPPPRAHRKGAS
ncbi:hypothetical protein [Streptomyces sp. BH055]|uniref:hypothetical protein n=1 Tax=Streptomyces sp. BH055 TaxID=3401173 RepID=UPI003BB56064